MAGGEQFKKFICQVVENHEYRGCVALSFSVSVSGEFVFSCVKRWNMPDSQTELRV